MHCLAAGSLQLAPKCIPVDDQDLLHLESLTGQNPQARIRLKTLSLEAFDPEGLRDLSRLSLPSYSSVGLGSSQ